MIRLFNDRVEVTSNDAVHYDILNKEKEKVGGITLSQGDPSSISFFIDKPWRSSHYCTNALYLLDSFLHNELKIEVIQAVVRKDNEIARHVLEHNGFFIVENETNMIYEHHNTLTSADYYYQPEPPLKVIYLAGGCFWGVEKAFSALNGVNQTKTGYANGHLKNPTYEDVCRGETGFKETVRITYDPNQISLDTILKAYFIVTDPTKQNQQGNDIGEQYQSGIYYKDPNDKEIISAYLAEERKKHTTFFVELKPLDVFYEAEEYHQDYLTKNPDGYCHITLKELSLIRKLNKNW